MSEAAAAMHNGALPFLTTEQHERLTRFEGVIKRNFQGFVEVGLALKAIRDERLYIASHQSFEQYCREKFELERTLAYKKIEAAEVVRLLEPPETGSSVTGELVENFDTRPVVNLWTQPLESHARKLAELPVEDRPEAWRRAVQRGVENHGRVTAKTVGGVVSEMLGKRTEKALITAKNSTLHIKKDGGEEFWDPSFTEALQALLNEIGAARLRSWRGAPKNKVISALKDVINCLEME